LLRRIVVAALVAVTGLVVAPGAAPLAQTTTDLLVGDSVMAGMSTSSRSSLPHHVFDAKVCRRLVSTSCSYRGVRPIPALDVVRAFSGVTNRAIVVAAGYNDGAISGAVDAVVAEARRQGVPHVVWLTYRVAGSNAGTYRSHNAVLWQKAQTYPELTIADWASYSAGRSSWVASDGLHLTGSGATAMANLVAGALAALPPPGPPPLDRGERVCFQADGAAGDVAVVNLTPVRAGGVGHGVLTASSVDDVPDASNVNYAPGTVDPNVAVAPVGDDGRVCYHNADRAPVHLVADHLATLRRSVFVPARPDGLPARLADTRAGGRPIGPDERRCFAVSGDPGDVAIVNLTPVRASARGYALLVASDVSAPADASNVNYAPGTVDPNVALAPIGADGQVCFENRGASVDLVADHLGTVDASVVTPATASGVPLRSLDTRQGGQQVAAGARRCFAVAGQPGDVAVVNLTPVRAVGTGHGVLVGGDDASAPAASNVNFRPGSVDPNLGWAAIGADGTVCFRNADRAAVDLVADHLVTIAASAVTLAGATRALDTRE